MSDSPESRSVSPLWFLLLIPVAAGVVWMTRHLPEPEADRGAHPAHAEPSPAEPSAAALPTGGLVPSAPSPMGTALAPEPAEAAGPVRSSWSTPTQAMSESQRNGKPILLEFTAEWSPEGARLRQEVFASSILGPAIETAVIPVTVLDREREEGRNPDAIVALREQFKVTALPTLVVFSPHTGRMVSAPGFMGADETVRWVTKAAEAVR